MDSRRDHSSAQAMGKKGENGADVRRNLCLDAGRPEEQAEVLSGSSVARFALGSIPGQGGHVAEERHEQPADTFLSLGSIAKFALGSQGQQSDMSCVDVRAISAVEQKSHRPYDTDSGSSAIDIPVRPSVRRKFVRQVDYDSSSSVNTEEDASRKLAGRSPFGLGGDHGANKDEEEEDMSEGDDDDDGADWRDILEGCDEEIRKAVEEDLGSSYECVEELCDIQERFPLQTTSRCYPEWEFRDPGNVLASLKVLRDASWKSRHSCTFKVLLIGDIGVGKSNLLQCFTRGQFRPGSWPTIGTKYETVDVDVQVVEAARKGRMRRRSERRFSYIVQMLIWDVGGHLKLSQVDKALFESVAGAVFVYSVTDEESFVQAKSYVKKARAMFVTTPTCILVGNKVDLTEERVVSRMRGEHCAADNGLVYMETSALEAQTVADCFLRLCSCIEQHARRQIMSKSLALWCRHKIKRSRNILGHLGWCS